MPMLVQILRFGLTGIINTLIDFTVFNLLLSISGISNGPGLLVINLIAVGIATLNSFFMNRGFTFQAKARRFQGYYFIAASLCGMVLNSLGVMIFSTLTPVLPLSETSVLNLGKIIGAILSSTWNFIVYRNWVFRPQVRSLITDYPAMIPGLTSIIIPAFNENHRLPERLTKLAGNLSSQIPIEIVVVDDGSTDNTLELVQEIARNYSNISCYSYKPNQGKGNAVRFGINKARGEYLIFTDADTTFTPEHILTVAQKLYQGLPMVIACRQQNHGERTAGESGLRHIMGQVFNRVVQGLLLPGFSDTQCGLKGFHYSVARRIFSLQKIKGFAFDVEILALARAMQHEIYQLPVEVAACPGSKVNQWLDPLRMLRDIGQVKWSMIINNYDLNHSRPYWGQLALGSGLFMTALALRIPWLWEFPRFIDELKEVNLAYQIYMGQARPLHNAAHDIGAMHNYLLAGVFGLLGPGIYWPRLYVACLSALGVVLMYHLGKRLYGTYVGLLAAILLLFNGMHILTSHMAWANCTTPVFFTAALLATVMAEKKQSGKYLVLSALLWAAALQTHASVIIYVLVVLIYTFSPGFRRRSAISSRWYLLAAATFLLGYGNMIYYNLISRGGSVRWLTTKGYALEQHLTLASYLQNLEQMMAELLRTLSSSYSGHQHLWQYLGHPFFALALALLLYGSYLSFKQRDAGALPLWLLIGTLLIMPLINQRYVFYLATRYIMPVVICAILMAALAVQHLIAPLLSRNMEKRFLPVGMAAGMLLLASLQYLPYARYCTSNLDTNASNRMALQVLATTKKMSLGNNSVILLDQSLPLENQPLPYLLTLVAQPYRELHLTSTTPITNDLFPQQITQAASYDHVIAVISDKSYRAVADQTHPQNIACLSSRIVFPASAKLPRNIYILEWDKNTKDQQ